MGSAVAGVFLSELGELSSEVGADAGADSWSAASEVNVDAHLMEGHERTESHAAGEQGPDTGLGEIMDFFPRVGGRSYGRNNFCPVHFFLFSVLFIQGMPHCLLKR